VSSSAGIKYNESIRRNITVSDFISQADDGHAHWALLAFVDPGPGNWKVLAQDIAPFKFLAEAPKTRVYPRARTLFFTNSYTDWHDHFADETLMVQVRQPKEVLLLPPAPKTVRAFMAVLKSQEHLTNVDRQRFPEYAELVPYRVVVEPSDALYIPVFWWHAVASMAREFGITLSWCWRTELRVLGDMRIPAARRMVKFILLKRPQFVPLAMIAVLSSLATRMPFVAPYEI
jgi:hypothetical protein